MYLFIFTQVNKLFFNRKSPLSDFKNWPRIVKLVWINYDEFGVEISRGNYLIKPLGFKISKLAAHLHGITNKEANKKGQKLNDALRELVIQIKNADYLVDFCDAEEDKNIIGSELLRNNFKNSIKRKRKISIVDNAIKLFPEMNPMFEIPSIEAIEARIFQNYHKKLYEFDNSSLGRITLYSKCFFEMKKLNLITK